MLKYLRTGFMLAAFAAGHAAAQEVTLRAIDGGLEMTGTLDTFDGEVYQLKTSFGTIALGVDTVICEGAACPEIVVDISEFIIAGSSAIGTALMPALIEAYAFDIEGDLEVDNISEDHVVYRISDAQGAPYVDIALNMGPSDMAFAALEAGEAYIGISSRPVSGAERARLQQQGKGDLASAEQERILALDGLVVAVNAQNPILALSHDQVAEIFAGRITNWREVGGPDARINVYRRALQAGATQVFSALIMEPPHRSFSTTAFIEADNLGVSTALQNDPYGIGLTSIVDLQNANPLSLVSVCGQVSSLSEFAIKTEDYAMSRRMYAYVNAGRLPEKVDAFAAFLTSDEAQSIVEQAGYVSQNADTASLNRQGRRLAHALLAERDVASLSALQERISTLQGAARLSLTFRFTGEAMVPDNRALKDIERFSALARNGDFAGKNLMIIGFTDSTGTDAANQRQSLADAVAIRDLLVSAAGDAAGDLQFEPVGYGKLFPIGCNESVDGRNTNRRVEIWVN